MTVKELIDLLDEFPNNAEVEFDHGVDEKGNDLGESSILSVEEENGIIYLCPFEAADDDGGEVEEVIDVDFREVATVGNDPYRQQRRAGK